MKITIKQLRRIIKEAWQAEREHYYSTDKPRDASTKDYHRTWDGQWMSSPDWQLLEDGLIALGREDIADMLISIYELGGSRHTFPKIQAAVDLEDLQALDKIANNHIAASRKQSNPKWGRY